MNKLVSSFLVMLILILVFVAALAHAQAGEGYDLAWSTTGSGGTSSNGRYILSGMVGQPDAGVTSGGGYTLNGGFWGGVDARHHIYLPIVLR